ncbi:hypothetical protein ACFWY6_01035 [Streptomyces sp. NPDC059037]
MNQPETEKPPLPVRRRGTHLTPEHRAPRGTVFIARPGLPPEAPTRRFSP